MSLDADMEEEERQIQTCCMKTMLEAGADTSLEAYEGNDQWRSTFMQAVSTSSVVNTAIFNKL